MLWFLIKQSENFTSLFTDIDSMTITISNDYNISYIY